MARRKERRRRRWGRVRQLPSGRWQARYPGPDGLLRTAPRTFDTEGEADVWLVVQEAEQRRGRWFDPDAGRTPLGEYAEEWIAERPHLAPKTVQRYEGLLRLHVRPKLGDVDLIDLTARRVRTWRKSLLDDGVGEVTAAKAYRFLKTVMNTAVDDELVPRNPCRIKGAGSERSPERQPPTMEQVYALADAIGERSRALVLLAAFGALRWGELVALRRKNVDLRAGTVRVVASMTELGAQFIEGPPKSEAGKRVVTIPDVITPELRKHLDQWAEAGPDGRVFTSARGAILRRSVFQRTWSKATEDVGLPGMHFHDLRHAGATWAAIGGATLKELMEHLGHASARAAIIYQHAAADRGRKIADALTEQAREARSRDEGAREGHGGDGADEEE